MNDWMNEVKVNTFIVDIIMDLRFEVVRVVSVLFISFGNLCHVV
jgi:hypothetical protein